MTPDDERHGTRAGCIAHRKEGEKPCDPCREAWNAYQRGRAAGTRRGGGHRMSTTTNPLPILTFTPQPWMDAAACNGEDPDLFFPDAGDSGRRGKAVCARCPVALRCLDYALSAHVGPNGGSSSHNTDHGLWGGTTAVERDRIRRRRAG